MYEEFGINLIEELKNGKKSLLFKKISSVSINNQYIQRAFTEFIDRVDCDGVFTVADVLFRAESVVSGTDPEPLFDYDIIMYDPAIMALVPKKLRKNTFNGIYDLLSCRNGVLLDVSAIGGSIAAAEAKRFAVLAPKKTDAMIAVCNRLGIGAKRVGKILASDTVVFTNDGNVIFEIPKTEFITDESVSVSLDAAHFDGFHRAYLAVCSYLSCNSVSADNVLKFPVSGDIGILLARALGYFSAMLYARLAPCRIVFSDTNEFTVAVPRPQISDGDYLYFLKPRCDAGGFPEKSHHGQMNHYIALMKKQGTIKNVLPVKENISSTVQKLCGDSFGYTKLADFPTDKFGVIVTVPRGYSVNGTALGVFISN